MLTLKLRYSVATAVVSLCVWGTAIAALAQATDAADQLSSDDLIDIVLSENPGLMGITERANAAMERVELAGALDDPTLSYSLAPGTISNSDFATGHKVDLSQSLPWPGKRAAQKQAAQARANIAQATSDIHRLTVIAATKSAFAEWYFIHEALRINQSSQRLLDDLLATAAGQYAAGNGSQQDVLQAELEGVLVDNHSHMLRQQFAIIQSKLNALMNRAPGTALAPPSQLPVLRLLPPAPVLIELASTQHPELRKLEYLVAEKDADLRWAEKETYPDFRVSAGYNSLWQPQAKRWTLGVSINIPFDQSRRRAKARAADAERRSAQWQFEDRRSELLGALAGVHAEVLHAQKSIALFEDRLLPLSQDRLDAAIGEYESGNGDFPNVITAERDKLNIEQALFRAKADLFRSHAELELRIGGPIPTLTPGAHETSMQHTYHTTGGGT